MMKRTRREFVRILFAATQAAVAGRFLPAAFGAEVAPKGLNFVVVGDWGGDGVADLVAVAGQMAKGAAKIGAKFVISVGDNFYENGVTSVDDPQWKTSFEQVYGAPSLQVPWQVILGNHDYHANCDAQIAYGESHPRWKMPSRYYVQSLKIDEVTSADFFYIDTTPMLREYYAIGQPPRAQVMTQDVPAQMAWFKHALAASTAQWKIVVGHHPIYSGGEHGGSRELVKTVLPLLHEHKVQVYFNGHDHDLQQLQARSLNMFCSGAGSQYRKTSTNYLTKFAKGCSGFTTVNLQADQMIVKMIDSNGTLLYTATVPRVAA